MGRSSIGNENKSLITILSKVPEERQQAKVDCFWKKPIKEV
jgi:hypothetical protein